MSHLSPDVLWDLAATTPLPVEASAHLTMCPACTRQLSEVQAARALLRPHGPPPPLNPIAMRRIGAVLKEAAATELKPRAWWWPFELNPLWALAGAAAVVLMLLVYNQGASRPAPTPIAHHPTQPVPEQKVAAVPTLPPEPTVPMAPPKRMARVTTSRKANNQQGALAKSQELAEGSTLKTAAGGTLWLQLPEGSRAGLTGNSELQLDKLEDHALDLTLTKGNVLVMARHLPDRLMTIRAGEVEVRDLGTRFLVSRDVSRVLVAVEEGVVEVNAPGSKITLRAGRSAEWREGRLWEQAWTPSPVSTPTVKPTKPATTLSPPTPAIEAFAGGLDAGAVAAVAATPPIPQNPDEEWAPAPNAAPTGLGNGTAPTPSIPPVMAGSPMAAMGSTPPKTPEKVGPPEPPPTPEEEEASVLSLTGLEQRLKKVARAVKQPFAPVGLSGRESRAREIGKLADGGSCEEALKRAEEWMAERTTDSGEEPRWKRSVQVNQLRCYTRLHRDSEANRLKELLQ